MLCIADGWKDYAVLATGDGYKLERWGKYLLLRPDPQVIWNARCDLFSWRAWTPSIAAPKRAAAHGNTENRFPRHGNISYKDLTFKVMPMGFKHTGLFPEQATNWERTGAIVRQAVAGGRKVRVLNLFAYTGGASVALAKAGRGGHPCGRRQGHGGTCGRKRAPFRHRPRHPLHRGRLQKICSARVAPRQPLRTPLSWIRPPTDGAPNGEMWKIETELFPFVRLCAQLLTDDALFFLINSYTTGLQPTVLSNILTLALDGRKGKVEAYEVGLPTEEGIPLPCGAGGLYIHA